MKTSETSPQKRYRVQWSYDFNLTVDELWQAISNTDRLNQGLGLPHVSYEHQPRAIGGSGTLASFKLKGLVIRWVEHPYEWIKGKFFEIERDYLNGPLNNVVIRWDLEARPGGGSVLIQKVEYTLKHWAFWPIAAFQFQVEAKLTVFGIYRRLNEASPKNLPPRIEIKLCPPLEKKVHQQWMERLRQAKVDETRAAALLGWIESNSPTDLIKIRPYRLAKELKWTREETLSTLLRATDAGVFTLNWGLLCPECRGTKIKRASLSELPGQGHCETCNIQFGPDFSKNVELTFRVSSAICATQDVEFCAGGPQNTPHTFAQFRLKPGKKSAENLQLVEGTYQIRSLHSRTKSTFGFSNASAAEALTQKNIADYSLRFSAHSEPQIVPLEIAGQSINLSLENAYPHEILVVVEQAEWMRDVCSAFNVVNTREFRELFPTQVVAKTVEFQVASVAIMFTDLKDSTALYEKVGDARALEIVVTHLEKITQLIERNHGFVVKTIGDAAMAVFQKPENSIQAAIDIQSFYAISELSGDTSGLHVKIGIHKGSVFAVNLNQQNDFFGGTVNIAARTQSKSGSDQVILTAKMIDDPGVKQILRRNRCVLSQVVVPLRGLLGEYELYEMKFRPDELEKIA